MSVPEIEFELSEIDQAAQKFWQYATGAVFAFHGEMGAGKTTFIAALCRAKGVVTALSSPTFSLINEYAFFDKKGNEKLIYHMDMYRLKDEEEAMQAGVEDCLYSGNICMVEWPEKVAGLLPENATHVYISLAGNQRRLLKLKAGC
ncbi:MAG: tRNA (adenosine(37)-N6)-threonylcarbamoyltransferase complex ATPase subunit type 1 TsaE [Chitinophagaceae bacterium]|nr:tRNA (adenosine(37)-N6)-threonylcarbamoyltransferase complex ATPase subunit type 1 TsaE [Chitinophagaceae bacterium]MCW5929148.1 tRNA (adenosine(37)-N6)-threonylcarbamoyltransferase complex ATPase subunit type 1 TsaE [Chitinophagaceae bacterium]